MGPSPKRSEQMPDEWKVDDDLSLQPTAIGASLEDLELNDIESPVELVRSNGTIARDSGLPRLPMGGVDRDARDVQSPAERMMYRAASTARGLVRLLGIGLMVAVLVIAVMNWPPWVIESAHARVQVMSVLFAAGLFIVAVEDIVGINKSAMMMVLAAVMWTFLAVGYHPNNSKAGYMQLHEELNRGLEEVGSVLLFLLPAMGVVESIDHFDGFALVNMAIRRAIEGRKDRLMPIICILTFFLSSIIDNLTSTIVAVKILRRLAPENQEYRQLCGGLAVIAANAGGAWSPIGDVTTTMLWISDRISATKTVLWLFFPSLVAGVLPLWFLRCRARRLDSQTHKESQRHKAKDKKGPNWEQEPLKEDIDAEEKEPITRKKITALIFGVFCILMVPGLKMGCGLPPYLGMLLALGLMWLLTDVLQMQGAHEEEVDSEDHGPPQGGVVSAMKKVDLTGLLFFTGVLLAIGALDAAGVLKQYATMITKLCKNSAVRLSILLGLSSALVDNVPLVEASIDMFREETNSIGVKFEFDIGSSNNGRTQAKNLVCMDASSSFASAAPGGKGDATDGSRLQGQIKEVNQDGGIIISSTPEELFFTPNDLPAAWQRKVMAGECSQLQKASVLFTLALAQGRSFAKEVMVIPDPEEVLLGEVVQFNPSAGYGFIKPIADSVFQQDVYFNIKDLARPFTDQERMSGLIGLTCRFTLRLTPDNRPQGRRVETVTSQSATAPATLSRFSFEPPPSVLQPGASVGVPEDYDPAKYVGPALLPQGEKRTTEAEEESAAKRQAFEQA